MPFDYIDETKPKGQFEYEEASAPAPTPKADPLAEQKAFKQQYIAQEQAPMLDKAIRLGKEKVVGDLAPIVSGVTAPFRFIGSAYDTLTRPRDSATPNLDKAIELSKSLNEGEKRVGFGLIEALRDSPKKVYDLAQFQANPLMTIYDKIKSRTPTDDEAQQAFEKSQRAKAYEEGGKNVRSQEDVNQGLAKAASDLPNTLALVGTGKGLLAERAAAKEALAAKSRQLAESTGKVLDPSTITDKSKMLAKIVQPTEYSTQQRLASGAYDKAIDDLKPHFTTGGGAPGFEDATWKRIAENNAAIKPALRRAPPELQPTPESLKQGIFQKMQGKGFSPEDIKSEYQRIANDVNDTNVGNITEKATKLNKQLSPRFAEGEQPTAIRNALLKAQRDTISENIHRMLDATGDKELGTRYQQNGLLYELQDKIGSRYVPGTTDKMIAEKGGSPIAGAAAKIANPIGGKAYKGYKVGKYLKERYGAGEMGDINKDINKLMSYPPSAKPVSSVPEGGRVNQSVPDLVRALAFKRMMDEASREEDQ